VDTVAAPFGSPAVLHLPRYYGVVRLLFHPSTIRTHFDAWSSLTEPPIVGVPGELDSRLPLTTVDMSTKRKTESLADVQRWLQQQTADLWPPPSALSAFAAAPASARIAPPVSLLDLSDLPTQDLS
jgi:hypothetical protein